MSVFSEKVETMGYQHRTFLVYVVLPRSSRSRHRQRQLVLLAQLQPMSGQSYVGDGSIGAVVLDLGSMNTRAGWAGDDQPTLTYASAIGAYHDAEGRWCSTVEMDSLGWAQPELQVKRLHNARAGEEADLVFMQLCRHGLRKLRAEPRETPIVMTEAADATAAARRHTAELAFESLGTPALCVARTPELSCIAAGRVSALVLELGAVFNTSCAVVDGTVQPRTVQKSKLSTGNLARLFEQQLAKGGTRLEPACTVLGVKRPLTLGGAAGSSQLVPGMAARPVAADAAPVVAAYSEQLRKFRREELSREVFESVSHVVEKKPGSGGSGSGGGGGSAAQAAAAAAPAEYTLPDGNKISVQGVERFRLPEYLFQGSGGADGGGGGGGGASSATLPPLQTMALSTLALCESDYHKELVRNVVLTGGGSCLPGLTDRLEMELKNAARRQQHTMPVVASQANKIALLFGTPNERKHGAWVGGSILGSMRSQHELWMSKAEYEEIGSALIHRKGMRCV